MKKIDLKKHKYRVKVKNNSYREKIRYNLKKGNIKFSQDFKWFYGFIGWFRWYRQESSNINTDRRSGYIYKGWIKCTFKINHH